MRVMVLPTDGTPEVKEIDGSLSSLQSLVGGYIELVYLEPLSHSYDIVGLVDEEGKLKNKAPNHNTVAYLGPDMLVGDIVLLRADNDGEFQGLRDEDIRIINELT